ncbi:MAG: ABC transporter permease [Planctomycetota bacterium]
MSNWFTLTRREVGSFFYSIIAYVVFVVFALLVGWDISSQLKYALGFSSELASYGIPLRLFGGGLPLILLLLITPMITMRLLAEERKSGTLETLMTAPVTDVEVVLSKFTAGWIVYLALWVPSLVLLLLVSQWPGDLEVGPIFSGLFGIACLGAVFVSAGLFASSLTSNQIVAAILGTVINFVLFLVPVYSIQARLFAGSETADRIFSHMDISAHLQDFGRGLIDTSTVVYYVSLTGFFLFLTVRSLEARKWS